MIGQTFNQNRPLSQSLDTQGLKTKTRSFWVPLSIFFVITALSITVLGPQTQSIFDTREHIVQLQQDNRVLVDKKNKLTSIDKSLLTRQARIAVSAIPVESSGLAALATVRNKAFSSNITINQLRVSEGESSEKDAAKEVRLQFEISGSLSDLLKFIDSLSKAAPLLRIASVKMVGDGVTISTDLEMKTFWAELPVSLPPLNTPLNQVNKKDQDLLGQMNNLKAESLGFVAPASASARENPFAPY
ncbi:MAG: hypothetical protein A2782_01715 [Candidatus Blackburnbacteria bacterium RIFCSPHIGHO2_01_FULL_43_15b]|uniref:Uncharacterized protein n=1 Tax=Candidatus Blackburnbacteria bacterium RIFCSPHIGHO2_01_FULL_43_15b TaxID=1797513 RepID=A0A1G1UXL6_9BACT|nr:MAG: hypothetical protein A2782_01715 [Candidatus Blackburnbacteria bacterium RIFCSPHIGHO2_01_FULL_43_15b]